MLKSKSAAKEYSKLWYDTRKSTTNRGGRHETNDEEGTGADRPDLRVFEAGIWDRVYLLFDE